jgi:hypothetical protein
MLKRPVALREEMNGSGRVMFVCVIQRDWKKDWKTDS